jgi:hypothetical protein
VALKRQGRSCETSTACTALGTYGSGPNGRFVARVITRRSASVPGAPSLVLARPGNGRVALSWTPPLNDGGAPVGAFTATLEPDGEHCRTTGYHCTIGGLAVGRRYVVAITATNRVGTGSSAKRSFTD